MPAPSCAELVTCPRCGGRSVPVGGSFCPFCGYRSTPVAPVTLRWVALPPPGASAPAPPPIRGPYAGAPRYRFVPRWGFPARAWVPPAPKAVPPTALQSVRSLVGTLVALLWATAAVALVAAGAEVWRYVLLLASREGALSAGAVATSDALVTAAGVVAPIFAAVSGVLVVGWTIRASRAAADRAGVRASRSPRELLIGWLVPGVNLAVPGSAWAEIEHMALHRPPGQRPHPSRLLLVWWALWATGVVLAGFVLLWSLRTGVQARADGVLLHALLDALAAVTAAVTAVLVTRLTRLLGPARVVRRELLVRVGA